MSGIAAPTLVVPLMQRLIHTINCGAGAKHAYSQENKDWCERETKESLFA